MIQDITGAELNVGDVVIAAIRSGDLKIIRVEEIVYDGDERFSRHSRLRRICSVKAKTFSWNVNHGSSYRYFSGPFYKVIR